MIQLPDDFNASDEILNFQNNTKPKINKSIHIKGFEAKQKKKYTYTNVESLVR